MQTDVTRLIDALPGMVWTARADGSADHVGRAWLDFTGMRSDEAVGGGWMSAVHAEDAAGLQAAWTGIVAGGQPGEAKARLRRADGAYRWFLLRASPLPGRAGDAPAWCVLNLDIDGQVRAEAAAGEHQRRFQNIVDGLPAIVVLCDRNGVVSMANQHMLDFHGWSLERLQQSPPLANCHPDDQAELLDRWRRCLRTGEPLDGETRLLRADGAYLWHRVRALPLRNGEGGIDLWYGLLTDIDDTKRAEAKLAAEKRLLELVALGAALPDVLEELCRQVEDLAPGCYCSILLVDPAGPVFRHGAGPSLSPAYNAVFEGKSIDRTYGPCSLAATIGAQVITADVHADARWAASPWPALVSSHGLQSCWSTPILSADRRVLGVFALYHPRPENPTPLQRDLIDRFSQIAGIAVERAQGEDALRAREAELSRANRYLTQAQSLSRTGSFTWDMTRDEQNWSEETYRIWEFEPGATVTRAMVMAALHPEDGAIVQAALDRAKAGKAFEALYRIVTAGGVVKHLHTVGHRIAEITDRLVYVGATQDVTEGKLAEEALNRARADLAHVARVTALSALTASIAHEVNQPLAGIITNASTCLRMLAADPPDIEGARATAQRTIRDGNRASEVIQRLRQLFARKSPGLEPVELNAAAREVLALSSSELQRRRVVLRTDFAEDLPPVEGDRVQLQQVILNLVLNAADAMSGIEDRPRDLWISTGRDQRGHVTLSVRDAGVGIDPQHIERLFDAFYTTKSEGMGIGLSISRSIIQGHDGRLVAAANDGPGATFSFSIPSRPGPGSGREVPRACPAKAGAGAQHVSRSA